MLARAALTIGHRSKCASGAGSDFTEPRCTASGQLSIDTHCEELARNPRTPPSIDCHGMIRSLVGHYSRSQASLGLHTDDRILSSYSRMPRSRSARAAPEALSRRPVHSERPTEHRHQSRRARSQPSDAAEHRLPRNDRDSSRALLPLWRARGCTSTRGSSRQARACRAHGWLIGTGRNSRAPLKPRHGGPATQRERVIRGVVRRFRCSLWQPRFRTSFGCAWRRRSRFGRRSLRPRPSRGGRAPRCEEWRALPFSLESTPPLVSARSSAASKTGVRRSCGSRAF
jgi:hypothetical protein